MKNLFGVYVHWPFCASKCPYCDFNSHVAEAIDHAAWRRAYAREIAHAAALTPGRVVTSVFFGGGTPSLMEPETVAHILQSIASHWTISPDAEITLEANPTSVEAGKFRAFRDAGVNRVSIGVQSLDNDALVFLGRRHDTAQALKAIETAAQTFPRYSFDLIYALPGQTADEWSVQLGKAIAFAGAGHLSLYQLTIEEGTPFYMRHARGEFTIPEQDLAGEMYEVTQDILSAAGLPAYEVSNHAAAGQESAHNLTYWRYADYAGIGPGAHGRLTLDGTRHATRGHRAPDIWMNRVEQDGHGWHAMEPLSSEIRFSECLMMGLRLTEGVPFERLDKEGGGPWQNRIPLSKITALEGEGMVVADNGILRATPGGLQRLNGVLGYLLS